VHGADDVCGVGALAHVAVDAEAHGPQHEVPVAAAGEHEHPHPAVTFEQHPGQLDARGVAAAERDVEDDEIGWAPVGDHEGVARRGGLSDHGHVRVGGEQLAQPEADDGLVVHDEDAGGAPGGGGGGGACRVENGVVVEQGVSSHRAPSLVVVGRDEARQRDVACALHAQRLARLLPVPPWVMMARSWGDDARSADDHR
jgi:hypothetical protein